MSITSSLESFSLPELFRLIEEGSKSGRLIVHTPLSTKAKHLKRTYYIWFDRGYLVAVSDRLNYKGLINLIADRGWLSPALVDRLRVLCPPEVPLGVYLEKMKILSQEQLNLIFQLQLHQVYQLFDLGSGRFRFDELSELQDRLLTIPWLERTGHKIRTTEVTMYALRLIENWNIFSDQLPEPDLALKRLVNEPHLKLLTLERQMWDLADGSTSLMNMARVTLEPLKNIQITAFRMIVVGLVEEIFLSNYSQERLSLSTLQLSNLAIASGQTRPNRRSQPWQQDSKQTNLKNLLQLLKNKFL
jgi:hypothetical protein